MVHMFRLNKQQASHDAHLGRARTGKWAPPTSAIAGLVLALTSTGCGSKSDTDVDARRDGRSGSTNSSSDADGRLGDGGTPSGGDSDIDTSDDGPSNGKPADGKASNGKPADGKPSDGVPSTNADAGSPRGNALPGHLTLADGGTLDPTTDRIDIDRNDGGSSDSPRIVTVVDDEPINVLPTGNGAQPLCAPVGPSPDQGVDVWSTDDRVALLHGNGLELLEEGTWAHLNDNPDAHVGLVGFGPSLLLTFGEDGCGISQVKANGSTTCSAATSATDVVLLGVDAGIAVSGDRVFSFDGSFWTQFGDPLVGDGASPVARSVWANDDVWVAASDIGLFVSDWRNGSSVEFSPVPNGIELNDVWADADAWTWAGTRDGRLLLYDGNEWSEHWALPSADDCDQTSNRIEGVLGSTHGVFFHTRTDLFVYRNGQAQALLHAQCAPDSRIWAVWGDDSTQDVLVAVEDASFGSGRCSPVGVLRFDGEQFTRL